MEKSPDAFRTISEVADWLGIQAHVLRFWESKFTQVKPVKRAGGRRYYRPSDMRLLGGIKKLLHDDGLTIKGVQKILREQGVEHVYGESQPLGSPATNDLRARGDLPKVMPFQSRFELTPASEPDAQNQPAGPTEPPDDDAAEPAFATDAEAEFATRAPRTEPVKPPDQPLIPVPETPALPSFLHRSNQPADGSRPAPDPEPPAAAAPVPRLVEIADPPSEDEIPYVPGPLGRLVRVERLSPDQAAELAPVAAELKALLERMSAPPQA